MLGLDLLDVLLFAAIPAFAWLLLRVEESQIGYSPPTRRDRKILAEKPRILQISARHTKVFRLTAVGLMAAALWTARTSYWPYATVAFGFAGLAVWMLGLSWFFAVRFTR